MFAGKTIECRAAVAWEPGKPISIEKVQVEPPKAGEVRLQVISSGICHTDWNMLVGKHPCYRFPVILGHEGAAVVESIGDGVTSVQPGDHVIPLYYPQCKECEFCKHPKSNFCSKIRANQIRGLMPDGTSRFSSNGKTIYHFMGCSTFSDYTVVAEIAVAKVREDAPLDKICLLGCAIPTGYGAVRKVAKVEQGSTVVVFGLGGIGLAAVMGARLAGAKKIIGIDINSNKFGIAKEFGCTDCMNPTDFDKPIQQVLTEMSAGGVDYTIECCGQVSTMRAAFESTHMCWGVAVAVGIVQPGLEVSIVPDSLLDGRTWKGCSFGGYKGREELPTLVEQYMKGEIKVDEFITGFIPLEEINEGFNKMMKGESVRTVVKFDKSKSTH